MSALPPAPRQADGKGRSGIQIPELDGVRGLAILLVLLFHFQGARPHLIPKFLTYPMILGWSGVDLFFVLSGFLITGILMDTRVAPNYFSSFYARRVLRIFPLYLLAVLICFHVGLPLARHFGQELAAESALEPWYWLHVSNWRSAFGPDVKALSHVWSLSIEEQFYLVWPFVVLVAKPKRMGAVCTALVVLALGLRCYAAARGAPPEALHRLTPFRADSLAFGGLVAAVVRRPAWRAAVRRRLSVLTAFAVGALVPLIVAGRGAASRPMTTLGYTAFAFLYACLVFGAFDASGSSRWLSVQLRRPSLRALGKYSYAMYMFHYPIAVWLAGRVAEESQDASEVVRAGLWLGSVVLGILGSFGLALLSWNL
ncbi:MAG TPA: acyltransferase, partial [Thermoanaerobaculia bacterium]|nr:acyltransferase [Thermoanaerobaculia bacterium]